MRFHPHRLVSQFQTLPEITRPSLFFGRWACASFRPSDFLSMTDFTQAQPFDLRKLDASVYAQR